MNFVRLKLMIGILWRVMNDWVVCKYNLELLNLKVDILGYCKVEISFVSFIFFF